MVIFTMKNTKIKDLTNIVSTIKIATDFFTEQTETGDYSDDYEFALRDSDGNLAARLISDLYGLPDADIDTVRDYLKLKSGKIVTTEQIKDRLTKYIKSNDFRP